MDGKQERNRRECRKAKQAGAGRGERDAPAPAAPEVWTPRMLTALEKGVKGGKWFSLIDKVHARGTLEAAFRKVRSNKGAAGVDNVSIARFEKDADRQIERLSQELQTDRYQPRPVKRVYIPKPGSREKRPLGIPTVRDRVAQTALRMALEPIFERGFAPDSYGFRPARGCKEALREVDKALHAGLHFVVDADIQGYFDSIPHDRLMQLIERKIADGRVLSLLRRYLEMDIFDGLKQWTPEEGTPQGAIISPLLSNIYLDPLDHRMAEQGFRMVRYADDFIVLTDSPGKAEAALAEIREWMDEAGLTLHPEKTRIVDATRKGGFDFLGYHFERGMKWARRRSVKRLREKLKPLTQRNNGHSMEAILIRLNPILRGWYEYFKHGHWNVCKDVDGWVRMRLRSILRKRSKRKGRGRGNDHQRWPNAYFAKRGLLSLFEARKLAVQSARQL